MCLLTSVEASVKFSTETFGMTSTSVIEVFADSSVVSCSDVHESCS